MPHGRLSEIPNGHRVTIAGLVLVRQRPGIGNAIFMTLEDEGAIANVIVWIPTFEQYRPIVLGARVVAVTGKLQNELGVILRDALATKARWIGIMGNPRRKL